MCIRYMDQHSRLLLIMKQLHFRIEGYKEDVAQLARHFTKNKNSLLENINRGMPENVSLLQDAKYLFSIIKRGKKFYKNFIFRQKKPSTKTLSTFLPTTASQLQAENFITTKGGITSNTECLKNLYNEQNPPTEDSQACSLHRTFEKKGSTGVYIIKR